MTTALKIIRLANSHGFEAMARDDGAAVIIAIPYTNRLLGDGIEMVEVASVRAAYEALGY